MHSKTVIRKNILIFLLSMILSNASAWSQARVDSLRAKKNTSFILRLNTSVGNVATFPIYKSSSKVYGKWGIGGGVDLLVDQEVAHFGTSSTFKLKPGLMFFNTIGRPLAIPVFDPSNPEAVALIGYERLNGLGFSLELCQNLNIRGVTYNISIGGDYHWFPSIINRPYPDMAAGAPINKNKNLYASVGVEPRLKRIASFNFFLRQARMNPIIINLGISTSIHIL